MTDDEELEFAYREYAATVEHFLSVLLKHEEVPASIGNAVIALCNAIEVEWGTGVDRHWTP